MTFAANDLGLLLLQLGGRLGRQLPRLSPPPEAYPAGEPAFAEFSGPEAGGWYNVAARSTAVSAAGCCDCGQPTRRDGRIAARIWRFCGPPREARRDPPSWRFRYASIARSRSGRRTRQGGMRGLNFGAIAGILDSAGLAAAQGERTTSQLAVAGLAGGRGTGGRYGILDRQQHHARLTRSIPALSTGNRNGANPLPGPALRRSGFGGVVAKKRRQLTSLRRARAAMEFDVHLAANVQAFNYAVASRLEPYQRPPEHVEQ